jgi:hypothetical protein
MIENIRTEQSDGTESDKSEDLQSYLSKDRTQMLQGRF